MRKAILNTFAIKVFSAILSFATVILLSQLLGATGKGEASLILTTVALVLIFCNFVGGASLVYLVPRHNLFQLLLSSYFWSLLVCIVVAISLYFFPTFPTKYIFKLFLLCLFSSFIGIHSCALIAKEKIILTNTIRLAQVVLILLLLLFFFFVLKIRSIDAYIFSFMGAVGFSFLLSSFFILKEIEQCHLKGISQTIISAFRYGIFNQLAHITQYLSFRISYYMISLYWGEKTLGVYSNGASIAESIWLISSSICLVQYSKISNSENKAYNRELTIKLLKMSILFSMAALVVLLSFPASFFQFVFGPEFGNVTIVIRGLAPGILCFNLALVVGHYYSGTGQYHMNTLASFLGLVVTFIAGFILIPLFPLMGAAITASLSYLVTGIFITYLFLKEEKTSFRAILPAKSDYIYLINRAKDLVPGIKNR